MGLVLLAPAADAECTLAISAPHCSGYCGFVVLGSCTIYGHCTLLVGGTCTGGCLVATDAQCKSRCDATFAAVGACDEPCFFFVTECLV